MLPLIYIIVAFACAPITTVGVRQFSIESTSMEPTLAIKSIVAVHRCGYGLSRYTFDGFELSLDGRLPAFEPARGDVIIFRPLRFPEQAWVKRVIGLPGDMVELRRGRVYLNGYALERRPADAPGNGDQARPAFREFLPGVPPYSIYQGAGDAQLDTVPMAKVRAGMLYVLGDNRDNSLDSRTPELGQISIDRVIGPVIATNGWSWSALFNLQ